MNRRSLIIHRLYVPPTLLPERGGLLGARTGLSPPAGYLYKPWGRIAFKRGHQPRHHAYANEHHSSLAQGHPCLSGALVLERPIKEDETKP